MDFDKPPYNIKEVKLYFLRKLWAKFVLGQVINIGIFQSQAIEIQRKVSAAQRSLLAKVKTIRDNCLLIDQVLENLSVREREVGVARVAF